MRRAPIVSLLTLSLVLATATALGCSGSRAPAMDAGSGEGPAHVHAAAGATDDAPAADPSASYSVYELGSAWLDQRGDRVALAGLAGKVRVVAMVYTSCAVTCPLILADLKRIEAAIPADRRSDVGFVLVSLDPDRDTPGRLAEFAAQSALDESRWTLLNGDAGAVRELAATLGIRYQPQPDGEVAHTNAITVLDAAGRVAHQQTGLGDADGATRAAVAALLR